MEGQSFIIFGLGTHGEVRFGHGKKAASSGVGQGKMEKAPTPLVGPTGVQTVGLTVRAM